MRILTLLLVASVAALLSGCGSIVYHLPGHTAQQHTAPARLTVGQRLLALETPARLPVPGGFWLGLASEDPKIVAVEAIDSRRGATTYTLIGRNEGETTIHYVNRFTVLRYDGAGGAVPTEELRALSLGSFRVRVGTQP